MQMQQQNLLSSSSLADQRRLTPVLQHHQQQQPMTGLAPMQQSIDQFHTGTVRFYTILWHTWSLKWDSSVLCTLEAEYRLAVGRKPSYSRRIWIFFAQLKIRKSVKKRDAIAVSLQRSYLSLCTACFTLLVVLLHVHAVHFVPSSEVQHPHFLPPVASFFRTLLIH